MTSYIKTVVIGGGYAGLAASHYLSQAGMEHVVLERGRIGETWRSQRWDSFALNTNNRISTFPGESHTGRNPEGFALRDDLVGQFEHYAAKRKLPVQIGIAVTALEESTSKGIFRVSATGRGASEIFESQNIIVATGFQNERVIPPISSSIPQGVLQLHAADYRNPGMLPPGAVLVVGSAQSGCQIAEDLLDAGRRVFLSVSMVARIPRRHRGRDIIEWLIDTGIWDERLKDLKDPKMEFTPQPQISGVGTLGQTLSLQHIARKGAILTGRLTDVEGGVLHFADNVAASVKFADERSAFFKQEIDKYIQKQGIAAPESEPDPADVPDDGSASPNAPRQIALNNERINTLIWCTGFKGVFNWIRLPVFTETGRIRHERGVSSVPGIYFLGAPWLYKRKSGVLYGMNEDAGFIVQHIDHNKNQAG